jgi:hypothetical protein
MVIADEVQVTGNPKYDVSHLEPLEHKYHRTMVQQ